MRQVTLRGIPADIEALAKEEARSKGVSLNKALLAILRKGVEKHPQTRFRKQQGEAQGEFSQFLGLWSNEEADSCDTALLEQRRIDDELWS